MYLEAGGQVDLEGAETRGRQGGLCPCRALALKQQLGSLRPFCHYSATQRDLRTNPRAALAVELLQTPPASRVKTCLVTRAASSALTHTQCARRAVGTHTAGVQLVNVEAYLKSFATGRWAGRDTRRLEKRSGNGMGKACWALLGYLQAS